MVALTSWFRWDPFCFDLVPKGFLRIDVVPGKLSFFVDVLFQNEVSFVFTPWFQMGFLLLGLLVYFSSLLCEQDQVGSRHHRSTKDETICGWNSRGFIGSCSVSIMSIACLTQSGDCCKSKPGNKASCSLASSDPLVALILSPVLVCSGALANTLWPGTREMRMGGDGGQSMSSTVVHVVHVQPACITRHGLQVVRWLPLRLS